MTHRFTHKKNIFDGTLSYINKHYYQDFSNYLKISSTAGFNTFGHLQDLFPPTDGSHLALVGINPGFIVDFQKHSVNVTGYSVKSATGSQRILNHWKLEARTNNSDWIQLNEFKCTDCSIYSSHYIPLEYGVFDSFKLTKLNYNDDDTMIFDLYGFEIFGQICNPIGCDVLKDWFYTSQNFFHIFPSSIFFTIIFGI